MNPLTNEQKESFHEAATPLMKWLQRNTHPHCKVVVDCNIAELVEGVATCANFDSDQFKAALAEGA